MRCARPLLAIAAALAVGSLAACSGISHSALPTPAPRVLVSWPGAAGWQYTLDSVASCRVTDAVTLVRVAGDRAVRVEWASAVYAGDRAPAGQVSLGIAVVPAAHAAGYVGATAKAPARFLGRVVPAAGAVLRPERTSRLGYALVLHVRLAAHARAWGVRGIVVRYAVGSSLRWAWLSQSLHVAAAGECGGA